MRTDEEPPTEADRRVKHIVFVGLPGVGKSSVGRAVAARLGRAFVDTDTLVEQSFGKTVSELFAVRGESAFRKAELEATRRIVLEPAMVVATGGGWIVNAEAVAHLRDTSRIIYLRVTPHEALRRMGRGISRRPLLASGDAAAAMIALHERRSEHYKSNAHITVDTTGVTRSAVIARVLKLVLSAERDFH